MHLLKGLFRKRCPFCNGTNLYLKRTSPMEVYGCRDCDKRAEKLMEMGLTKEQAIKSVQGEL